MNGRMNGWMDEWMNEWMNEWMDEWMNKWMNAWMNEMNGWTMQCNTYQRKKKNEYAVFADWSLQLSIHDNRTRHKSSTFKSTHNKLRHVLTPSLTDYHISSIFG